MQNGSEDPELSPEDDEDDDFISQRPRIARHITLEMWGIIQSVYDFCTAEFMNNKRRLLSQVQLRTAEACGIGYSTFKNLLSKPTENFLSGTPCEERSRPRYVPLQFWGVLRTTTASFYANKTFPTLDNVLAKLKADTVGTPLHFKYGRTTLYRILKQGGFTWGKSKNHYDRVKENVSIVAQRNKYLRAIEKYRDEGREFFFQDET